MYTIERKDKYIIVRDNNTHVVYRAPEDSLLVYKDGDEVKVAKASDLPDSQPLLALVNAVRITDFGRK